MNQTKPKSITILSTIFYLSLGIIFSMILLISVIQHYSFSENYFKEQFRKNNVSSITGFNENQLNKIIHQITGYLSGQESSLNLPLEIDGKETLVFNNRELAHMLDVKVIYVLISKIKIFGIILLLLFILPYSIYVYKNYHKHRNAKTVQLQRRYWMNISKIFIFNGGFTLILMGALGFMIFTNFSKYFILFHRLFFDNDLWLLDPSTDRLIQMLPENFFYDISFLMISRYAIISIILSIIGIIVFKILKKDDSLN